MFQITLTFNPSPPPFLHTVDFIGNQREKKANFEISEKGKSGYIGFLLSLYLWSQEVIKSSWPAKIFLPSLSFSFSCQHSTFLASSISALPPRTFFPQICHRSLPRKEKSAGRICLHDVVHWHRPHFPQNISVIIAIIRFSLLSMQHFSGPILLES